MLELCEGLLQAALDDDLVALHGAALAIGDGAELEVVGEVVDGLDAVVEQAGQLFAADAIERAHVMFGALTGQQRSMNGQS